MPWQVRTFEPGDDGQVRDLLTAAFGRPDEAALVDRLRASPAWLGELALVDLDGAAICGFSALTRIRVGDQPALALAPVAVMPAMQRQGFGTALIRESIRRANEAKERLILVLGSPEYYGRFGFTPAMSQGIHGPYDAASSAFQGLVLDGGPWPTGMAVYPPEFADL